MLFFYQFNVVCLNLTDSMNKNAIRFLYHDEFGFIMIYDERKLNYCDAEWIEMFTKQVSRKLYERSYV